MIHHGKVSNGFGLFWFSSAAVNPYINTPYKTLPTPPVPLHVTTAQRHSHIHVHNNGRNIHSSGSHAHTQIHHRSMLHVRGMLLSARELIFVLQPGPLRGEPVAPLLLKITEQHHLMSSTIHTYTSDNLTHTSTHASTHYKAAQFQGSIDMDLSPDGQSVGQCMHAPVEKRARTYLCELRWQITERVSIGLERTRQW